LLQKWERLDEKLRKVETKFNETENPKQKQRLLKKIVELERSAAFYANEEYEVPPLKVYGLCCKVVALLN
jgi:hypothetical protein